MQTSRVWQILAPFLALLVVIVIFASLEMVIKDSPKFLTLGSAQALVVEAAPVLMAALGMTLIIITGGIDLSVGNMAALSSMVLALLMSKDYGFGVALGGLLGVGLLAGIFNGGIIAIGKITPFIVTLGTMTIYLGLAKLSSNSQTVTPTKDQRPSWLDNFLVPMPESEWMLFAPGVWLVLVLALIVALVLRFTVWGRYLYAFGSNPTAAKLSGLPTIKLQVAVYAVAGLFFALAGFYSFCRLTQGSPTEGKGLELRVIAAVVVGGASLSGGQGTILGTVCGTMLIAVVSYGCKLLGFKDEWQDILLGVIIIGAVAIDRWRQKG